jgi:glycosyltransferase involved in cell wall biosynthesis
MPFRWRILAWPRELPFDPYYKRLYDGLEKFGWKTDEFTYRTALHHSYGIVHIHQGTFPFRNKRKWIALPRLAIAVSLLWLARARGAKLVWSLHNLGSHEQYHPRLEAAYLRWISRTLSSSFHMSESGREAAVARYPGLGKKPSAIVPLMHFSETFGELPNRQTARAQLGLKDDLKVILMLGQIRRYKNVPELIRVFRELPGDELRLFVVGNPLDPGVVQDIRRVATDPRISLSLQTAPVAAVKVFMAAADLVVAPYHEVLNSGSALLALTHHRPVLLPNRGAMAELHAKVGGQWVRIYEPPLTPAELGAALDWAAEQRIPAAPDLSYFAPDRVVEGHAGAFADLSQGTHRPAG